MMRPSWKRCTKEVRWHILNLSFFSLLSLSLSLPPSDLVPTACLNKLRWGCMRVTWSPLRPGLSPNVPKSGPSCPRTFCSPSLSWVSHLLSAFPVTLTMLCSKNNTNNTKTTCISHHWTRSSDNSKFHNYATCLSSVEEKPSVLAQGTRLCTIRVSWPSPTISPPVEFWKISITQDKLPLGNVVIIEGSCNFTQRGLIWKKDKSKSNKENGCTRSVLISHCESVNDFKMLNVTRVKK